LDTRFYEAWINTEHRVLGRKLHPFCLEDALILSLSDSPFLLGTEAGLTYDLEDLQLAATVCSLPGEVFLQARFNRSWQQRLRTWVWSGKWQRRCATEAGLAEECQKFVTYIDDYNSGPETWQDDDAGAGQLRAPWILSTVIYITQHSTYRPREVWKMPIGQAFWIAAVLAEQRGSKGFQFVSEEEAKGLKELGF
jgi:hypothetical protein